MYNSYWSMRRHYTIDNLQGFTTNILLLWRLYFSAVLINIYIFRNLSCVTFILVWVLVAVDLNVKQLHFQSWSLTHSAVKMYKQSLEEKAESKYGFFNVKNYVSHVICHFYQVQYAPCICEYMMWNWVRKYFERL